MTSPSAARVEEALQAERLGAARAAQWVRLVGCSLWVAIVAVSWLIAPSAVRRVELYILVPYLIAASISVVVRNLLRVNFRSHLLTVFLDIPVFGGLALSVSRVAPEEAPWNCGFATAMCCMAVAGASTSLRRSSVVSATASAVVVLTVAHAVAGQLATFPPALVAVLATSAFGLRLMQRVHALLLRVGDEAAARVRDVVALNEELRRQIADRAGQLAAALARLQAPQSRSLDAGTVIEGRYRVLRLLGKGGMGAVYEVERTTDGRRLALKTLTGSADRENLARFAREAQIAAQLNHPNVVSVLDIDVSSTGILFLVMELVDGPTLAGARLPDRQAVETLRQIAAALAAMHAGGIVHRDLKPSNVLLQNDSAKVADFGIASLQAPRLPDGGDSTVTAGLTRTGVFMGTPLYMAPELARGVRHAQPSSDMWSFGVLAYELLGGRHPFAEPPVMARLEGRALPPPPPLSGIDGVLRSFIERCLAEDPAARPSAAGFPS